MRPAAVVGFRVSSVKCVFRCYPQPHHSARVSVQHAAVLNPCLSFLNPTDASGIVLCAIWVISMDTAAEPEPVVYEAGKIVHVSHSHKFVRD